MRSIRVCLLWVQLLIKLWKIAAASISIGRESNSNQVNIKVFKNSLNTKVILNWNLSEAVFVCKVLGWQLKG